MNAVTWKSSIAGYLSTAGTTATVIIFKNDNIYIANVGDSTAIMARSNPLHVAGQPEEHPVKAVVLTKDHKPDDPQEISNIANLGMYLQPLKYSGNSEKDTLGHFGTWHFCS